MGRFPHADESLKNRLEKRFEDNVKNGEPMRQGGIN